MLDCETELGDIDLVVFDFDGVFTDNAVWVTTTGVETVRCSRSDGLGLAKLRSIGLPMHILSTEVNTVVAVRAEKLNIPVLQGIDDKSEGFLAICSEYDVDPTKVAYLGNDINDIPALKLAGTPIAVADAHEDILPYVVFKTSKAGGQGAVRELCDMLYQAKLNGGKRQHGA